MKENVQKPKKQQEETNMNRIPSFISQQPASKCKKPCRFTLIELLVVIAIIGIR